MTVAEAYEAAMGLPMVRLQTNLLDSIPSEMVNGVAAPVDLGIRAVGTYRDICDPDVSRTAEPSLILGLGPKWDGRDREVLELAAKLAGVLDQQTVAAFLPRPDGAGDSFHLQWNLSDGRRPTVQQMDESISDIQEAYSLHLDEEGRVKALDVIGMDVRLEELDNAVRRFDHDPLLCVETGDAYLVDRTGQKIRI